MAAPSDPSSPPTAEHGKPGTRTDDSGGTRTSAVAGTGNPGNNFADEEDEWRHAPVAPQDQGVLDSLGRSVSEAVTGSDPSTAKPKPAGSR